MTETDVWVGIIVWLVLWVLVGGFVASAIWKNKGGNAGDGFVMGALLGILGIILAAAMTPGNVKAQQIMSSRECPFCKQQIRRDASVCSYCQRESEPWLFKDGYWWVRGEDGWYYLDPKSNAWVRSQDVKPGAWAS